MLIAEDIAYKYKDRFVLDGVNISIEPGKIQAILGPNGSGKSTLLKLLSGELQPTAGSVSISQRRLSEWPGRDLARIRAVLAQETILNFDYTVLDVVMMGRSPHIEKREEANDYKICRKVLKEIGLEHLENRFYLELSGGEKQRVQIARVMAQLSGEDGGKNRYLLLDEPTSGLDLSHQHSILKIVKQFANEGGAVLMVLHQLNLALAYADEIAVLLSGKVYAHGKADETLTAELVENVFCVRAEIMKGAIFNQPFMGTYPKE